MFGERMSPEDLQFCGKHLREFLSVESVWTKVLYLQTISAEFRAAPIAAQQNKMPVSRWTSMKGCLSPASRMSQFYSFSTSNSVYPVPQGMVKLITLNVWVLETTLISIYLLTILYKYLHVWFFQIIHKHLKIGNTVCSFLCFQGITYYSIISWVKSPCGQTVIFGLNQAPENSCSWAKCSPPPISVKFC